MANKDREIHYDGLRDVGAVVQTPNTVSRSVRVGDRAFQTVVWQSGKAVLDSELLAGQDAILWENGILGRWQIPSGWLRGQTHYDGYCDYITEDAPHGLVDDSGGSGSIGGGGHIALDGTLIDAIVLPRLEAVVAGRPVVVEYTNTRTVGYNLVTLGHPTIYDGTSGTVKRTDFVFLEVWKALVAPSPKASGMVQVADSLALVPGVDRIVIAGLSLTASAVPGANLFIIDPASNEVTATNIATALNDPANAFALTVAARAVGDTVFIESFVPGAGIPLPPSGNFITLAVVVTVPGSLAISGPTLSGGEDRPNKPLDAQGSLYRHGNVLSPAPVWLADEIVDPVVDVETTQRIQQQYRIRATEQTEAVNYKKHPDGFSTRLLGNPTIFAQAGRLTPAGNVGGRFYPFVPADGHTVWGNSSAAAYETVDAGLWVAGDGSDQAAEDLGAADGFVFAIPICFAFRHNDVSSSLAGFKGFDPTSNANGAPLYGHAPYVGPLGAIPAGASDRPDGHFADVVTLDKVLDLRHHVIYPGVDAASELQYQIQSVLDGSTRTWAIDTADKQDLGGDSGDVGTQSLICNEVGRSHAHGGNNVTSGDTQRGVFIRDFDHIARRFGDQSVVERVVFAFYPGDRPDVGIQDGPVAPGLANPGKYVVKEGDPAVIHPVTPGEWYESDILVLDLTRLDATTLGGIFQGLDGGGTSFGGGGAVMATFMPPGTVFTDVLSIWHDDGNYTVPVPQQVEPGGILGLGTQVLRIWLDRNHRQANGGINGAGDYPMVGDTLASPGSPRRIFVEVEITYPIGVGTTDSPDLEVIPDGTVYNGTGSGPGPVIENDQTQRPNDFEGLTPPLFRQGYRETHLEYVANDTLDHNPGHANPGSAVGVVTPEYIVSTDNRTLHFPRRVYGGTIPMANQTTVTDVGTGGPPVIKAIDTAQTEFGSSSRKVVIGGAALSAQQTLCQITYFPQDPVPNYGALGGGYQLSVYFRSTAPQTAGVKEGDIGTSGDGVLPTTLLVEPLLMGPDLWTGQRGSGSIDPAYPYGEPLDQIPINDGSPLNPEQIAGTVREWYFCATANIAVDDFNANTGLLSLHPFVQADVQNVLVLGGANNERKPRKDAEWRAYYPFAADWLYRPTILSQPLYGSVRHKVIFPFLARVAEEVPGVDGAGLLFRQGEVVLVVLTRFAELDAENNVQFLSDPAFNRVCAGVYKTRNLLLVVGNGRKCLIPAEPGP